MTSSEPRTIERTNPVSRVLLYAILLSLAIFFLAPLVLMLLTSLRPTEDFRGQSIISWPGAWSFYAWTKAWGEACIGTRCVGLKAYYLNSFLIVVPAAIISTTLGAINGFALSKLRLPGGNLLFILIVFGVFIPYQAILIPAAQLLGKLGLLNTIWGLILVQSVYGIPICTLFFRNYYAFIPDELIKAAKIDGAGYWTIFFSIILPLSPPIIAVTLIWQFTAIWNDFLFGVTFSSGSSQPVIVALNNLVNTTFGVKEYNVDMAGTIITALPTLVIYVLAGKYFVRGLTVGSVKG
ncbi:carbohydrate ABC transporter permease [Rhizobium sp. AG207R]|uniref:carbohydrate ABC transporter permease n=1 Tax=Rhizobium sp. AG207R TaxID=2802287 RepID=UPI0022AC4467|nr:carbohydrate ABC transporter permease [Rhizobium sp. AG207R]MCZ3374368.1 carbohydrate ABC transporter permease [Rhizobium sp. AG207R]